MAMINGDHLFVDTNILIYATDPHSPFHQVAFDRLEAARRQGVELIISPQILREYLAAATRAASGGGPTSLADALANFRTFRATFTVLVDSPAVLDVLDRLVGSIVVVDKQVHDANIVATMVTYGIRSLLTHNTGDFARFAHLMTIVPLVPAS